MAQKDYTSKIAEKPQRFDRELASQRISIKNNLTLTLLPEDRRDSFGDEVGRVYGLTSSYVHLTPSQIVERIMAVDAGRIGGKENTQDFEALISLVERGLAVSLVLLFHSVPEYVAGDWLVESDGTTTAWVFVESRFIAGIDSHFDYKHERQDKLDAVRVARSERSRFDVLSIVCDLATAMRANAARSLNSWSRHGEKPVGRLSGNSNRTEGIASATMRIGLINIVYNMRRFLFLERLSTTE